MSRHYRKDPEGRKHHILSTLLVKEQPHRALRYAVHMDEKHFTPIMQDLLKDGLVRRRLTQNNPYQITNNGITHYLTHLEHEAYNKGVSDSIKKLMDVKA